MHIGVTSRTSAALCEIAVFYSRDLFRVHSIWLVPGTINLAD